MRVAFFGLDYHARTGSSRFLLDLVQRHATVDAVFAPPDVAALRLAAAGFDEARYDAIIVWQLHEAFALLSGRHRNVTFAPMLDAMWRGGAFTWRPSFDAAKILCFSWALREQVMRRAPVHALVQYYPDPAARPAVRDFDALRGFLWYRRRDIPPGQVFALTAGARFDSLAIHDAPDPGHEAPFPTAAPAHVGRLLRSTWSADGAAFAQRLAEANVFFAPRPMEGIGMAVLEAMAAGMCVVAPDAPTMNEYVSHGRNGLLYAPGAHGPLDFARAAEIGARARDDIAAGHARWSAAEPALVDFLLTPMARLAQRSALLRAALPARGLAEAGIAVARPNGPLPEADWLLALPEGAAPGDAATLAQAVAEAPAGAGIIRGHHLLRGADGAEALHRTAEPAAAWARVLRGDVSPDGPAGFGVPEATLVRPDILARLGAALPRDVPALADLLLQAQAAGVAIHDADAVLVRAAPAPAGRAAWLALARRRAGAEAEAEQRLDAGWDAAIAAARARDAAAAPARRALALVAALDRASPALARAAERLLAGGAMRRLRAWLRR
ncbi:glycosyltransferase [Roseomonas fluvialis]|uniref:Glycosyl transferase family 1 domain-containing protein n=1 Tax=Roseomonas fluvialis TaxID=1750527 RepID=A0ABN6NYD8_9PROT|nr:glycosyltransferase [Roseomonas fluvialis]BDG70898.1 hypothetical protein Rmf_08270 [Roseomonas fluvialis]